MASPAPGEPRLALSGESPILKALSILSPELSPDGKQGFLTLGPPRMAGLLQAGPALHQALGCWSVWLDTSLTSSSLGAAGTRSLT